MAEFSLFGRVHPDSFSVAFENLRVFEFLDETSASIGTFEIEIVGSDIAVRCQTAVFSDDALQLAYMRASEACQAMVDVAGLRRGLKLFAIIDRYVDPQGVSAGLVYGDRVLGELVTAFTEDDVEQILDLVLEDLPLRYAVTDLMSMLWWPSYAPIACGRVVDSVRRMVTPPETPEPAAWSAMHKALNFDAAYLRFVTNLSRGPRHGHRVEVSGADSREMAIRAWTVINRYIAYTRGGRVALSEPDFPLLRG